MENIRFTTDLEQSIARNLKKELRSNWLVMIMDEEDTVHINIKKMFRDFDFQNQPIQFVSAYHFEDAKNLLDLNPDVALVIMGLNFQVESENLEMIEYIRFKCDNHMLRILIITSDENDLIDQSTFLKYEINDLILKSGVSKQRLQTSLMSALRSYQQLEALAESRDDMKALMDLHHLKVRAVNASNTGIALTDQLGSIKWFNNSFIQITGFDPRHLQNNIWEKLLVDYKIKKAYGKNDYIFANKMGSPRIAEVKYEDILDTEAVVKNSVIALYDITERETSKKNLYKDIEMARKVQMNVLPPKLEHENLLIKGRHKPYEKLGGDMYYWKKLSDDVYGVAIIDVMGHGIATSLITMYIRSLLAESFNNNISITDMVDLLQRAMNDFNHSFEDSIDYYFTGIFMRIDTKNEVLDYINAGHPGSVIVSSEGKYQTLDSTMIPIGILDHFESVQRSVDIKDTKDILLYSDGFCCCDQFSFPDLLKEMGFKAKYNEDYFEKWFNLVDDHKFDDDVSLIWIRRKLKRGEQ